jgi:catechol 2,3-dioxygenase-like lactoylglutathione lyase family enzyme
VQIAIPAGGEERARAFYIDVLGLLEISKPPGLARRGGLWLRGGAADLHLGVDPDFHAARKAHPALRCGEYEALLRRLESSGVAVVRDEQLFQGRPHCYVTDPFGNRIELIAED